MTSCPAPPRCDAGSAPSPTLDDDSRGAAEHDAACASGNGSTGAPRLQKQRGTGSYASAQGSSLGDGGEAWPCRSGFADRLPHPPVPALAAARSATDARGAAKPSGPAPRRCVQWVPALQRAQATDRRAPERSCATSKEGALAKNVPSRAQTTKAKLDGRDAELARAAAARREEREKAAPRPGDKASTRPAPGATTSGAPPPLVRLLCEWMRWERRPLHAPCGTRRRFGQLRRRRS